MSLTSLHRARRALLATTIGLTVAASALLAPPAFAQPWPTKPVTLVCLSPPAAPPTCWPARWRRSSSRAWASR